jgi:GNAT superfamily N-acetyltransferase
MTYTVRRALPSERPELESLLAELMPGQDVAQRIDWIHHGNPHGKAIVWFAVDNASGKIAGCTTYFPREIVAEGKIVKAALGGDCWVRPAFRRRGIAQALHARGRAEMPDEGMEVMYGTPTKANESPLLANGAKNIGYVARFVRLLEVDRLPLSRLVLTRGWHVARLEPLGGRDPRVDDIWQRMAGEIGIGTVRDAAYYDWRYVRAPAQQQRPFLVMSWGKAVAACALEVVERSLHIVDLVAPRSAWGIVFSAVIRHAARHHPDCDTVAIRLSATEGEDRNLWRYGVISRQKVVFNILLPAGEPRASLFYDPRRWYVTMTDTDTDHS